MPNVFADRLVYHRSARDYHGSRAAGLHALLLRRPDQTPSDGADRSSNEILAVDDKQGGRHEVETVPDLAGVVERVIQWNAAL